MFTFLLVTAMYVIILGAYITSLVRDNNYRVAFDSLMGLLLVVWSLALVKFL
jgi:hypothetical protein